MKPLKGQWESGRSWDEDVVSPWGIFEADFEGWEGDASVLLAHLSSESPLEDTFQELLVHGELQQSLRSDPFLKDVYSYESL